MKKGLFIVLEGAEGASKTTQAKKIATWLEKNEIPYILTREPDGPIRDLLLDPANEGKFHPYAEALLFAASRIDKYKRVIEPALAEGKVVICDRYLESSVVYQGIAQDVGVYNVLKIHDLFVQDERVTILLRIPAEVSMKRLKKRGQVPDRMEGKNLLFHETVVGGYDLLARQFPRIHVVDATKSESEIHEEIKRILIPHLEQRGCKVKCL